MILNLKKVINKELKIFFIKKYKYSNIHQVPNIEKIIINANFNTDLFKNEKMTKHIYNDLYNIALQKPKYIKTKKSNSNFHLRKNENIGFIITLRKNKKYYFLTKFIFFVLSQIKDFLGFSEKMFDMQNNLNLGIKEQFIFPEIGFQDLKNLFGFNINFIFKNTNMKRNIEYLNKLNFTINSLI